MEERELSFITSPGISPAFCLPRKGWAGDDYQGHW